MKLMSVRKSNINVFLMCLARMRWKIKSSDVTSAFLQSTPIERDVFVKPPAERRVPGVLWKLKKLMYGLVDASIGFFLSFSGKMKELGCVPSKVDSAMYIFFDEKNPDMKEREPSGIAVTHVDDVIHAGEDSFDEKVMEPLREVFKFGDEEEQEFRYLGFDFVQYEQGIRVNNDHYVEDMAMPNMDLVKNCKNEDIMDAEGKRNVARWLVSWPQLHIIVNLMSVLTSRYLVSAFGKQ